MATTDRLTGPRFPAAKKILKFSLDEANVTIVSYHAMEAKKKILRQVLLPVKLQQSFSGKCKTEGLTQPQVIEGLVEGWTSGRIRLPVSVSPKKTT